MSDVIKFANYETLVSILTTINQQVSGMSTSEAELALNAVKNSGLYIASTSNSVLSSNVVNFPNTTASQAISEYISGGGTTAISGAAVGATGDATLAANIAIGQTGIGQLATGVYGVLSTPLPIALAAIAPLAGVALGSAAYTVVTGDTTFYEAIYDELKDRYPNIFLDNSDLVPAVSDVNGNTYYSNEFITAFKTIIDSGFLNSHTTSENDFNIPSFKTVTFNGFEEAVFTDEPITIHEAGGLRVTYPYFFITLDTDTPYTVSKRTYTYQEKTVEYYYFHSTITSLRLSGHDESYLDILNAARNSYVDNHKEDQRAWLMKYGIIEGHNQGVSTWTGNLYPDTITPINILTGYDEEGNPIYTPYYPISIPISEHGVSNDPAVNPNPAVNLDPATVVNLLINPVPDPSLYPETVPVSEPAPLPNPVPETQPVPLPDIDPSTEITQPEKNPDSPTDPTDSGTTPTPSIPVIPTLPSSATGLLHVYNPTQTQIDDFGSWLWTTFSGDLIDTLSKLFNDPMDAVIGLHELYATPAVSGSTTIRCGYLDSGIVSNFVGSRYTTINCGSVVVEEYYQNYLDYSPYTHCFIYLPFIGIVPVSSDDIVGNAVNITYHVDSYTGCCIAVITVAKSGYSSTVYQFEGNCAVEIPVSSGYQSSLMSGLLAVAGTAITSNPSIGLSASHIGRAGLGKNTVQHSGSFGSSYGAMGSKIPYIIVKRPVQKKVYNYSESYGFPAHKMVYVGNCEGFLRAQEVRVTSTTATNIEKDMIVNALKSGVYVK